MLHINCTTLLYIKICIKTYTCKVCTKLGQSKFNTEGYRTSYEFFSILDERYSICIRTSLQ